MLAAVDTAESLSARSCCGTGPASAPSCRACATPSRWWSPLPAARQFGRSGPRASLPRTHAGFLSFGRAFSTWFVGHGMGALCRRPAAARLVAVSLQRGRPPARLVEIGGLCLALGAAGMVAYFAGVRGDVHSPLEFLPFPVAIWAAMRFGVRGATAATLLMSGVALAGHFSSSRRARRRRPSARPCSSRPRSLSAP